MTIKQLMKTPDAMKGRKLLIRHHEAEIEQIRHGGLYMATATIKRYYTSTKWVDIEYVVEDSSGELEKNKLHLDQKFYRKDCTPEAFTHKK